MNTTRKQDVPENHIDNAPNVNMHFTIDLKTLPPLSKTRLFRKKNIKSEFALLKDATKFNSFRI